MDFIFDPSLVLYLPLHQIDGDSFISKDAYGHSCTVAGALWTPQGRTFDGVDDVITATNSAVFDLTTAGSIFAWYKFLTSTDTYGVIAGKAGAEYPYYIFTQNDFGGAGHPRLLANIKDSGGYKQWNDTVDAIDNTWYFFGMTWDSTTLRPYKNAVPQTTVAAGAAISVPGITLAIGDKSTDSSRSSKGTIGEVLLYNRVLTAQEIQQIYRATKWRYQ